MNLKFFLENSLSTIIYSNQNNKSALQRSKERGTDIFLSLCHKLGSSYSLVYEIKPYNNFVGVAIATLLIFLDEETKSWEQQRELKVGKFWCLNSLPKTYCSRTPWLLVLRLVSTQTHSESHRKHPSPSLEQTTAPWPNTDIKVTSHEILSRGINGCGDKGVI